MERSTGVLDWSITASEESWRSEQSSRGVATANNLSKSNAHSLAKQKYAQPSSAKLGEITSDSLPNFNCAGRG